MDIVKIGDQIWMKSNLNVDKFNNGDIIYEASTDEEWRLALLEGRPAWCYYDNDPNNGKKYGKLYNWYAVVDQRGLAPIGWDIPTDDEWTILSDYLNNEEKIGFKLKNDSGWIRRHSFWEKVKEGEGNAQESHSIQSEDYEWEELNPREWIVKNAGDTGNGDNSTGFAALPSGIRSFSGFEGLEDRCYWWSSSEVEIFTGWFRALFSDDEEIERDFANEGYGLSIRCLKNIE